jgi:nitroreductase
MYDELLDIIRQRRSIRRYRTQPVPQDLIEQMVEAASWAPSASNQQDWYFSIVTSEQTKKAMAEAVRSRWEEIFAAHQGSGLIAELRSYSTAFVSFASAPVVIVVSALRANAVLRSLLGETATATAGSSVSAAMATQNLMLAAHTLGLGTCCMTGALAAGAEIAKLLGLRRREIVCLVTVGYPDEAPAPPARKPVPEISGRIS